MFVTIFSIDKNYDIVFSKDAGNSWSKFDYKTNEIPFTNNIERFKVEKFNDVPLILIYLKKYGGSYYFRLFDGKQKWIKFDPANKEKLDKKLLEKIEEMKKYFYPLESYMTTKDFLSPELHYNKNIEDDSSINIYLISNVFKHSGKDNRLAIDFDHKLYTLDRYDYPISWVSKREVRVNYWKKLTENNLRHSTTFSADHLISKSGNINIRNYKQRFQIFESDKEFNMNTIGYNKNENLKHLKFMIDNIDKLKYKIPLVPSNTLTYNLDSWGYSTKYQLSKEISNSFCNYLKDEGYQDFYDDKCSITKIKYKYNETSKKCMYGGVLNWKNSGSRFGSGEKKKFLDLKNDSDKSGCLETERWSDNKYKQWIKNGKPTSFHWSNNCQKRIPTSYLILERNKNYCADKCNKNKDCNIYSYNNRSHYNCVLHTYCNKYYEDFPSIDLTMGSYDKYNSKLGLGPAPNHGWKYYKRKNKKDNLGDFRILQDEIYQKELEIKKRMDGNNKPSEEYNISSRENELESYKNINVEREKEIDNYKDDINEFLNNYKKKKEDELKLNNTMAKKYGISLEEYIKRKNSFNNSLLDYGYDKFRDKIRLMWEASNCSSGEGEGSVGKKYEKFEKMLLSTDLDFAAKYISYLCYSTEKETNKENQNFCGTSKFCKTKDELLAFVNNLNPKENKNNLISLEKNKILHIRGNYHSISLGHDNLIIPIYPSVIKDNVVSKVASSEYILEIERSILFILPINSTKLSDSTKLRDTNYRYDDLSRKKRPEFWMSIKRIQIDNDESRNLLSRSDLNNYVSKFDPKNIVPPSYISASEKLVFFLIDKKTLRT